MAASGRSPDPDDSNHGGGGSPSFKTSLDSYGSEGASGAASLHSPRGSSNPTGCLTIGSSNPTGFLTIGSDGVRDATVSAASSYSPTCHDDEGEYNYHGPLPNSFEFLLLRSLDRCEDDDGSAYSGLGFSDRTGGGASTSTSSSEDCDYPIYRNAFYYQIPQNSSCTILEKAPLAFKAAELESQVMKDKLHMLLVDYPEYRPIFGDGNCLYRSFIYSYLEQLVEASPDEELRLLHAIETMRVESQRFEWSGSFHHLYEDFKGLILDCMVQKQTLSVSAFQDWLLQKIGDKWRSEETLLFLRLVAATKICSEADYFGQLIIIDGDCGHLDVLNFCKMKIIPMGEEAEEWVIGALCQALQVPVQVVAMDSNPRNKTYTLLYESASCTCVTLLYLPGHYDILYPK